MVSSVLKTPLEKELEHNLRGAILRIIHSNLELRSNWVFYGYYNESASLRRKFIFATSKLFVFTMKCHRDTKLASLK